MEIQEKAMRPIPKNVRQIGERDDEIRLYIEDYVNTFIRKCARTDKLVVGALIGEYYSNEGKEYLFVDGAVQAEQFQVSEGRVRMTDEAWSGIYGKIGEFFSGRSICGWFVCGGTPDECGEGMLRGFMYENIGAEKRALIIHNTEAEEETFSVYDRDFIREQQGYYLFYERNEPMQSYMVTTAFAVRTDPVAVDAVTNNVRTRMVEKKELPVRKSGNSFVSAAALVVGVIALASGIVMMNHYEQLREMESILTNLSGELLNMQGRPGEESTEETDPKFAGLIIEDVAGDVNPVETQGDDTEAEDVDATEATEQVPETESAEPESPAETEAPTETSAETSTESPAESAGAKEYRTYLVRRGDTLVTICWRIYGYRDDDLIQEICEINQLVDKDHIYAGQELLIP